MTMTERATKAGVSEVRMTIETRLPDGKRKSVTIELNAQEKYRLAVLFAGVDPAAFAGWRDTEHQHALALLSPHTADDPDLDELLSADAMTSPGEISGGCTITFTQDERVGLGNPRNRTPPSASR